MGIFLGHCIKGIFSLGKLLTNVWSIIKTLCFSVLLNISTLISSNLSSLNHPINTLPIRKQIVESLSIELKFKFSGLFYHSFKLRVKSLSFFIFFI